MAGTRCRQAAPSGVLPGVWFVLEAPVETWLLRCFFNLSPVSHQAPSLVGIFFLVAHTLHAFFFLPSSFKDRNITSLVQRCLDTSLKWLSKTSFCWNVPSLCVRSTVCDAERGCSHLYANEHINSLSCQNGSCHNYCHKSHFAARILTSMTAADDELFSVLSLSPHPQSLPFFLQQPRGLPRAAERASQDVPAPHKDEAFQRNLRKEHPARETELLPPREPLSSVEVMLQ